MSAVYHHLIDDQCQLIHTDYNIVSIIGSQNSGKSTLLNRVFGTNFEMLQGSQKTQTTKGIWASHDSEKNILILDVEGSNSRQRGKAERGSEFYERSTALFALAFSQILIINCNSVNLGHESEYSIIKIIMEMNVRLFKSDQVKQILIVVRDFNDEQDSFEEVCNQIKQEIYGIWSEVIKPVEFQNVQPEAIFKIEFFKSAHYAYKRAQFEKDMVELRDRFVNPNNRSNLFLGYNYDTNIPIEALEDLAKTLWNTIQKNEDLNLPNQKLQASQVRCLKIKEQAIELVSESINDLKECKENDSYESFSMIAKSIIEVAHRHYDLESQYYVDHVKIQMRQSLSDELRQLLFPIFRQNANSLQEAIKKEIVEALEHIQSQQNFVSELNSIKKDMQDNILSRLEQLLPETQYRGEWQIDRLSNQMNRVVGESVDMARDIQFMKFLGIQERSIKGQVESLVSNEFFVLDLEFWNQIQSQFKEMSEQIGTRILDQCSNIYDQDRIQKELQQLSGFSYNFLKEEINKKLRELPYYLLKKFKTQFLKDENGFTRKWKQISEEDIKKIFLETRSNVESIIEKFTKFRISAPKGPTVVRSPFVSVIHSRDSIKIDPKNFTTDSFDELPVLLDQATINKLKAQFRDETDEEYNQVLHQKNTSTNSGIPKWLWFVLVFFMYDDVFRWMGNPLLLYPLILFFSFIGMCFATGNGTILKAILSQIFGQAAQVIGPLLLKLTK